MSVTLTATGTQAQAGRSAELQVEQQRRYRTMIAAHEYTDASSDMDDTDEVKG